MKSSQRQYSVDSYSAGAKFSKKLNLNKTPDKIWVQGPADSGAKVETPPLNKEGDYDDSPSPGPTMFDATSPPQDLINITNYQDSPQKDMTSSSGPKVIPGQPDLRSDAQETEQNKQARIIDPEYKSSVVMSAVADTNSVIDSAHEVIRKKAQKDSTSSQMAHTIPMKHFSQKINDANT